MHTLVLCLTLLASPEPKMKISIARVEASAAKAAVTRVLKAQLEPLKGCYDLALKEEPELAGTVGVKFDLEKGATAANRPTAVDGGLTQATLVPCVLARLGSVEWPKASQQNHVELTLKFALER
ncbi:MAG: AgmX/PglI C-terminal domain-containing protein [Archangiaceae bacterium]|nr:AgmX/PglI C-terminal domain-containing protein [Archangiaceae bacterium]